MAEFPEFSTFSPENMILVCYYFSHIYGLCRTFKRSNRCRYMNISHKLRWRDIYVHCVFIAHTLIRTCFPTSNTAPVPCLWLNEHILCPWKARTGLQSEVWTGFRQNVYKHLFRYVYQICRKSKLFTDANFIPLQIGWWSFTAVLWLVIILTFISLYKITFVCWFTKYDNREHLY